MRFVSDAALRSVQVDFEDSRTNQCLVGVAVLQQEVQHIHHVAGTRCSRTTVRSILLFLLVLVPVFPASDVDSTLMPAAAFRGAIWVLRYRIRPCSLSH